MVPRGSAPKKVGHPKQNVLKQRKSDFKLKTALAIEVVFAGLK